MSLHEYRENLSAARSRGTSALYAAAWRTFERAAADAAVSPLPAPAEFVAEYLSGIGAVRTPSTLRVHAAAIAARHRDLGMQSPTEASCVRRALAGHAHRKTRDQGQAAPIDASAFERITETAMHPRRTRGGRTESALEAEHRALVDVCLIGTMRDAMLRRSEAAALTWADFALTEDGSGTVRIRRSKTDQASEGTVRYVSPEVVECLDAMRTLHRPDDADRIFALSPSQICRRIASAAVAAGLVGAFSGHSPRVGMAVDLARAGFGMPMILEAGRWRSERTAMRYVEGVVANRGAVAQWYARREDADAPTCVQ